MLPAVTCDFTPLSFNLVGAGPLEAMRPFSVTAGDTFEQFILPPITATAASTASVILDNGFTGSVGGGVVGTFTLSNLNGLLVTNPQQFGPAPRGFEINKLVVTGSSGTITAVVALNFYSYVTTPPYYPRSFFGGYVHSIATSGAYAPYKYNGIITFGYVSQAQPPGGGLTLAASIVGRLYSGGGALNEVVGAARTAPTNSSLTRGIPYPAPKEGT
jgi:hypothetical protein